MRWQRQRWPWTACSTTWAWHRKMGDGGAAVLGLIWILGLADAFVGETTARACPAVQLVKRLLAELGDVFLIREDIVFCHECSFLAATRAKRLSLVRSVIYTPKRCVRLSLRRFFWHSVRPQRCHSGGADKGAFVPRAGQTPPSPLSLQIGWHTMHGVPHQAD